MRGFFVFLILFLSISEVAHADMIDLTFNKHSLAHKVQRHIKTYNVIFKENKRKVATPETLEDVKTASSYASDHITITKYGYDLFLDEDQQGSFEKLRFRGGISKASKNAVAGVQLIINW